MWIFTGIQLRVLSERGISTEADLFDRLGPLITLVDDLFPSERCVSSNRKDGHSL